MTTPLLTIVIPSYNPGRYLRECLESVRAVKEQDVEVLVQDGGSTDGSLETFDSFKDVIDHIESRGDHGQSDAIDRGFRAARGNFLTWLNADDVILPGTMTSLRRALSQRPAVEWFVGDTLLIDSESRVTSASRAGECISGRYFHLVSAYGPSSFFARRLYEQVGGLDLSFDYMMDTDLWNRFVQAGQSYSLLHAHTWGFREHEGSKTTSHMFTGQKYDPYAASEYRKNAERRELFLRHGINTDGDRERRSRIYARLLRLMRLSGPLQMVDTALNKGRHWRDFRRTPIR